MHTLKEILYAKSVAVVGASASPKKTGYTILKNILDGGFEGEVYPINPKEKSILGKTCYADVADIPGDADLLVICIPAARVPAVLLSAAHKGTKGAVIISGGFSEIGNEELDRELREAAKESGIRVIGPNCQGINFTLRNLCATWPLVQEKGEIGIVAQSGTIGAEMELLSQNDGLGISCFAALGNKADISDVDFINFFAQEEHTKVIALNMEGIREPSAFLEAVTAASKKKPVVILKPGRTAQGAKAVASHTSSIAGNDRLFSVFCRKYGILRADDITEFYDFCKISACLKAPAGKRLLVVTSSGGSGILAVDTAEKFGFTFGALTAALKEKLTELLPAQCVLSNPLDLTGDADAARFETVLSTLADREDAQEYDAVLAIFGDPIPGAADVIERMRNRLSLPIVVSYLGGGSVQKQEVVKMGGLRIPVFPTPERAITALGALTERKLHKKEVEK